MNLSIDFKGQKAILLPVHYNYIVQSFIYDTIDKKMARFLHEHGYGEGRIFRLFCFSNIIGHAVMNREKERLEFSNRISVEISSPVDDFCESFANGLFKKDCRLGGNILEVEGIKIYKQTVTGGKAVFDTLSPVVAYSTLLKPDNSKYTCYFQPGEEDFRRITEENLRKKYTAFTGQTAPEEQIAIKLSSQPKLHIINYKGTIIKGYTSRLLLSGPDVLLQMAADAGLGSKNSQGFGYLRMLRN
jgi:CRISPR-associated endoribonuclease Cas6